MQNETLKVQGMSCGKCVKAIESSVSEVPGVNTVKVNLEAGTVDVSFDNEKASLEDIKNTIDDQGYEIA